MNSIRKLLSWITTIPFLIGFALVLLVFHVFQVISIRIGYHAHNRVISSMIWWLNNVLLLSGNYIKFTNHAGKLPTDRPMIVISNHQSMYDISPLMWYMRKHHPKFISKKELGKGIPSVSYNLRHGGSVLIDRKKPIASIKAIENFAKRVEKNNWAAVIFPEGTRSRTGKPKPFKTKGLITLMNHMPNALIVPISINDSWKTMRYGKFPMGLGAHIKFKVHQPIAVNSEDPIALVKHVEQTIINDIHYDK